MIRITVELVPGGNEDRKKVIGVGEIANVTTLPGYTDEYVALYDEEAFMGTERGPYSCHLRGWPRTRKGLWELVHATIHEALKSGVLSSREGKPCTLQNAIDEWLGRRDERV